MSSCVRGGNGGGCGAAGAVAAAVAVAVGGADAGLPGMPFQKAYNTKYTNAFSLNFESGVFCTSGKMPWLWLRAVAAASCAQLPKG